MGDCNTRGLDKEAPLVPHAPGTHPSRARGSVYTWNRQRLVLEAVVFSWSHLNHHDRGLGHESEAVEPELPGDINLVVDRGLMTPSTPGGLGGLRLTCVRMSSCSSDPTSTGFFLRVGGLGARGLSGVSFSSYSLSGSQSSSISRTSSFVTALVLLLVC